MHGEDNIDMNGKTKTIECARNDELFHTNPSLRKRNKYPKDFSFSFSGTFRTQKFLHLSQYILSSPALWEIASCQVLHILLLSLKEIFLPHLVAAKHNWQAETHSTRFPHRLNK